MPLARLLVGYTLIMHLCAIIALPMNIIIRLNYHNKASL